MPMVSFASNGSGAEGYLALPPAGHGPGLIVLQEWWGLVDHIKALVDRFAEAGFVALAPDLYHGEKTTSPDEAGKLLMALNIAAAGNDLRGAATYLRGHAAVAPKKVGVIGFCMGGQLALFGAQEHPDVIDAAVDFYGIHPRVTIDSARMTRPVQGHFGVHDKGVPLPVVNALRDAINAAGGAMETHEYDAGHAFFNDARPTVYNAACAELAWGRTLAFLRKHLT